ncbi:MAG TPA: polysaccharide deacetylase family protein [Terriglobales bacterium]|jgi:peptidoglycan/xylan/chitin deacetylase (PgdA/CDA1 family)
MLLRRLSWLPLLALFSWSLAAAAPVDTPHLTWVAPYGRSARWLRSPAAGARSAQGASELPRRANLRGEVMILVYHNFGPEARWSRSLANFDSDLSRLESAGYRPVTLRQYVTADFQLPAGTTPVVLTFDDGSRNQMKFAADGQLDPDCAVAHWVAFAKAHPDFPVHGTFFVNPGTDVFGQRAFIKSKLEMLVKLGSEIGNHTYDHPHLNALPPAEIEREIGLGQYDIDRFLPGYDVTSFALPFGQAPHDDALAVASSWTGAPGHNAAPVTVRWHYGAVVLVGSGPAPSPLVEGLKTAHLPRIQVFTPEFDKWMTYFERNSARRFISDGEHHAPLSLPARALASRP